MAKKPRRYYSLINIDYDKIPLKYGEDQLKLPQMVIVLEMIKNGDIIIETLNPEDEDFLEKFYEQRNEVEVKNMKALSIHDTIFQGGLGLQKVNDDIQIDYENDVVTDDDGSSMARRSDAFLNSNFSSPEKVKSRALPIKGNQSYQSSDFGGKKVNNRTFSKIGVDVAPDGKSVKSSKKPKAKKQADKFAAILKKHVQKYGQK